MRLTLTALLTTLILTGTAIAQPNKIDGNIDGMIGMEIPQFLVYVPFSQQVTRCIGEVTINVMVRRYAIDGIEIRQDAFVGNTIVAHYLKSEKSLLLIGDDGKVSKVVPMDRFFPVQVCEVARGLLE